MIYINTDGGSRGNPGPSATGVYITDANGKRLTAFGTYLGSATNNTAEYTAVLEALTWAIVNKDKCTPLDKIIVRMDSQLLQRQLTGQYRVKSPHLHAILFQIRTKERELEVPVSYHHVPREQNKQADAMVNQALDKAALSGIQ